MVQLDALLARLPTLNNRDMIDSVAVEYCYLNSKSARKRLIKVRRGLDKDRVNADYRITLTLWKKKRLCCLSLAHV